ncbi:polyisoprenoid-binding protein YceI [Sphingomonas jejuensis]|uniref:Polyisoprenoid-binding protein YceI n=1 Tax=Sphingomonas jejuensis TaxID=904715 RepID=A0ABX0XK42_9SPHN|nr:YceI family protein [Sphingomonas jejuensis]NJC33232.1 polyisoprenoid-binding protein YceI [Sphingomonas jejuensis]
MHMKHLAALASAVALPAAALALQPPPPPAAGRPAPQPPRPVDTSSIRAGSYTLDGAHTQVLFRVEHFGFNSYWGLFGQGSSGTLTLDPAQPGRAQVSITIPIAQVQTTSPQLNQHLQTADFFDAATHPTATFRSTSVQVQGQRARIAGNLTLRGQTRPVVLDARLSGAGANPMNQKATVGFEATAVVKRSEFGINYAVPGVSDDVELRITAAFERN